MEHIQNILYVLSVTVPIVLGIILLTGCLFILTIMGIKRLIGYGLIHVIKNDPYKLVQRPHQILWTLRSEEGMRIFDSSQDPLGRCILFEGKLLVTLSTSAHNTRIPGDVAVDLCPMGKLMWQLIFKNGEMTEARLIDPFSPSKPLLQTISTDEQKAFNEIYQYLMDLPASKDIPQTECTDPQTSACTASS